MNKFPKFFLVCFYSIFFLLGSNFFIYSKLDGKNKNEIIVGFSSLIHADVPWEISFADSIIIEAKNRNINLRVINLNENKIDKQKEDIRSLIKEGVDILVIRAVIDFGWTDVLSEAKDAGIPVILVDHFINEIYDSLWVTMIKHDYVKEGQLAAEWLVENYKIINTKSKNLQKINIVELRGHNNSLVAVERGHGFYNEIIRFPEFNIIESESADWDRKKGEETMDKFLKKYRRKINVLFSHNDDMAFGAIEAISENGLKPGKDIIIVSIDAVKGAFYAMMDGKLNCTVECSSVYGPVLFDVIEDIINKKDIPKKIYINDNVFTPEYAREALKSREY